MVEAMFERSPKYFKQFQKQFKLIILEDKPTITSFNNYAVCPHFDSEFCQLATNHFHLIDTYSTIELNETLKQIKIYAVPCLLSTFKHLFSTSTKLETNGDVFSKLKLAIEYNNRAVEKLGSVTVRKRLPIFDSSSGKKQFDKSNSLQNIKNWWTENNPQCHLAFSRQRDSN